MRPEAARERDLHRYYKPWKDAQNSLLDVSEDARGEDTWGLTYDGYKPKASGDKALTAFAQLAALRLDVRRSMISLIDSNQQYILTEATRTLSLLSERRHVPGDEVWLGNTIIKRNDAVCHHSFKSRYTATDDDGRTYTTEALVVPDMRLDDRFKDRDYVVRKPGVLFYAGVPIKTKAGHRIGVYAVSNETTRFGLTVDELIFMEDVAATIMEHLELAKDRDALMNGSRMVRGLADFIEGIPIDDEPEVVNTSTTTMPINTSLEDQKASPVISAVMRKQTQNAKKMLEDLDEITGPGGKDNKPAEPPSPKESTKASDKKSSDDDPNKILQRATHIMRKSTGADGVIFFNTSSRTFQGLGRLPADHADVSSGITSGSDRQSDSTITRRPRNRRMDSGESVDDLRGKRRYPVCEVMGLSVSQHEQYGRLESKDFQFPEDNMERYLKNFPHGKFFSFTDTGSGISSGDELSAEDKPQPATVEPGLDSTASRTEKPGRNKKERFIPSELLKVLPGIRSLIFLPLWDFTEGKYLAGGFIWTSTAGRLMNPDNELPYLKAFGNSIMSEISRAKAQKSDLAKTTFIASISHELRSPLHGILGSVEFLHETAVSAYQAGLFSSIETCGKTLLDTIDHVLDYAKINKLRKGNSTRKRGHHSKSGYRRETVGSIVGLTAEFDLAALVEEVVDAVTAGHAFRRTHHDTIHGHPASGGLSIASTADSSLAVQSPAIPEIDPVVILDIKPRHSWCVRTQPGALRRIVMNLLGNALKYTESGFVGVSLQVESETETSTRIRLRFVDSGKGMSLEFQRTRLFSPFSQEDPFASGTGLGLSIVRQIVDALDGTISLSSTQNHGTEVDVVLTLPTVEKVPDHEQLDQDFVRGSKMCIVDPCDLATEAGVELGDSDYRGLDHLEDTLRSNSEEWFGMQVEKRTDHAVGSSENIPGTCACDYMLFPLPPTSRDMLLKWHSDQEASTGPANVIVLCSNTAQASDFRANVAGPLLEKGIQAVPVTQPLGPRKFASVMHKFGKDPSQAQDIDFVTAAQKQRIVIGRQDSDPEAMRREREMFREAEKKRVAEEAETADKTPTETLPTNGTQLPHRPGPGVIVNADSEADRGNEASSESPALAKPSAVDHNMTLARSRAGSASRSISAPPERISLPQQDGTGAAGAQATTTGPAARLPHVLLVDDNDINLQLLVMFMKKQNLSYATASNGLVALEKYESACTGAAPAALPSPPLSSCGTTSPTVSGQQQQNGILSTTAHKPFTHVLMDLSMPVMDGLTSTRKIRALEAERGVKPAATIIALTGLASAEAQDDALVAGINKFLVKPVKFGELKGLLKG